ncbi:MAG TPA: serine hydrolase domain-containing protein [Gemmatimonadales bacterium]|nr:serine hydrolase domain-containing protein [Gemmatimonadales bacterium]
MRSLLVLRLAWFALLIAAPQPASAQASRIDAAVRDGIRRGTFPGAVVVVGRADTILYARGYGRFAWSGNSSVPDPSRTLWDIASLSKVVGTASAAAVLAGEGRLTLDAPVAAFLPEFTGGGKDNVTVRMLLDHTSGLPAWAKLNGPGITPDEAVRRLLAVPLARAPGATAEYSDLNAILAGMVLERAAGTTLDRLTRERVFAPLGMTSTAWRPAPTDRTRIVPSARLADGTQLVGIVNDENARALGGVAGHAGLFSTGLDLARFAQAWLRGTRRGDAPWASATTLAAFLERRPTTGTRALGWDTPRTPDDGKPSLYGACATSTTVGHTGWTGTALWLDPQADLFVVLLTNRSYAPRRGSRSFDEIRLVRAAVSDAARRIVGGGC